MYLSRKKPDYDDGVKRPKSRRTTANHFNPVEEIIARERCCSRKREDEEEKKQLNSDFRFWCQTPFVILSPGIAFSKNIYIKLLKAFRVFNFQ